MAKFRWVFILQALSLSFFSLATARPNHYPRGSLPLAGPGAGAPASLFVRDEEWMPRGSCAAGSKISPREFQELFARDGIYPFVEKTMNPAFIDVLNHHGYNTDRLQFLGGGACGRVFRVKKDGTDYAAKITSADPHCRGAEGFLLREDVVLKVARDHPHIVQKYQLLASATPMPLTNVYGPLLYIMVTEFCKHGSLDIRASSRIRGETIRQIQGIWAALIELRTFGFYHKDIKPDNIMVQDGGDWKLGDFGSASRSIEGPFMGTIAYAPPEVLAVYKDPAKYATTKFANEKLDVFAFAVTMLEALYGKRIFAEDGSNTAECLRTYCWSNTKMSLDESKMFEKMLDPNPARRTDFFKATQYILMMKE